MKPLTEKDIRLTYQDAYYCGDEVIIATNKQEEVRAQILENQRIVKDIKKRIEEYKSYKQGRGIISENKPNSKFTVVDISDDILRELQKLVEGKLTGGIRNVGKE